MKHLKMRSVIIMGLILTILVGSILISADAYTPELVQMVSTVLGGITTGLCFALIGWPARYIPEPILTVRWHQARSLHNISHLTNFFHFGYGGLVFYTAALVGQGAVFGIDFTLQGNYPERFAGGSLVVITLIGCFWGLYLNAFGHIDFLITHKTAITYMTPLRVVGGAIFSIVFSQLLRSPFPSIALFTCIFSGLWICRLSEQQLFQLSPAILAFCFSVLPMLSYLSM
jgi:hypothetical protein